MKNDLFLFAPSRDLASFWGSYCSLVVNKVLPYQWSALNDLVPGIEPSGAMANFRIAAGMESGTFKGYCFQDSDIGKWIEAASWSLCSQPDPELELKIDTMVDVIEKAQDPEGYINTYFTIKEPGKRWTNLTECHELYSAGHLLEGAIAYWLVTGKRRFLDIMERYVLLICRTFGSLPNQIRAYDGHEEIELALMKLHAVTQQSIYLEQAAFFINERGREPVYFLMEWEKRNRTTHWTGSTSSQPDLSYFQAHKPVVEQEEVVGHAVRAMYLYTAMSELASRTDDQNLATVCKRLWDNMVFRKMYVTGGIGSTRHGEAFGKEYELPPDSAYSETCAAIGLVFFSQSMLERTLDSQYAEVAERALYNAVLASMSQDGKKFFYVNPLEVIPGAVEGNPDLCHVKPERQAWFGCACCPPNLARLLMSLGHYACTSRPGGIWFHQYIDGQVKLDNQGHAFTMKMKTDIPWHGRTTIHIEDADGSLLAISLRIPSWARSWTLKVKGRDCVPINKNTGYITVEDYWQAGDTVELFFELGVVTTVAHPRLRSAAGKICLQRGPLVYCLEEVDNGGNLAALSVDPHQEFSVGTMEGIPDGVQVIRGLARRRVEGGAWTDLLYRPASEDGMDEESVTFVAVPYYLWGNRGKGEMTVWIRSSAY